MWQSLRGRWKGAALRLSTSCSMTCAAAAAGKPLYLVLVSWLYALYSFDYRWGLSRKHLQQRIAFFQQHWAFFLGKRGTHWVKQQPPAPLGMNLCA